jgi:hypothetical protein
VLVPLSKISGLIGSQLCTSLDCWNCRHVLPWQVFYYNFSCINFSKLYSWPFVYFV